MFVYSENWYCKQACYYYRYNIKNHKKTTNIYISSVLLVICQTQSQLTSAYIPNAAMP